MRSNPHRQKCFWFNNLKYQYLLVAAVNKALTQNLAAGRMHNDQDFAAVPIKRGQLVGILIHHLNVSIPGHDQLGRDRVEILVRHVLDSRSRRAHGTKHGHPGQCRCEISHDEIPWMVSDLADPTSSHGNTMPNQSDAGCEQGHSEMEKPRRKNVCVRRARVHFHQTLPNQFQIGSRPAQIHLHKGYVMPKANLWHDDGPQVRPMLRRGLANAPLPPCAPSLGVRSCSQ